MPKYKLIKDLPFQKADDTEWILKYSEHYKGTWIPRFDDNSTEFCKFLSSDLKTKIIWEKSWGDPLKSGWFEEVKLKRWRAGAGGCNNYFFVDDKDLTIREASHSFSSDEARWNNYNYFRTKEQAEEAAKRLKKTLTEYQEEICPNTNS